MRLQKIHFRFLISLSYFQTVLFAEYVGLHSLDAIGQIAKLVHEHSWSGKFLAGTIVA